MATVISSKTNDKIKSLRKLNDKKYRDESGMFAVENLKIIYDALISGHTFESLFVRKDLLNKKDLMLEFILNKAPDYFVIDEKINKSFSALDTPSGICAVYKKESRKLNFSKSVIYLNGINDPGNMGTILRTALAFGFENIVIDEKCADIYNPKTIQAAKDAIFKLKIEEDISCRLFKKIKEKMPILTTRMDKAEEIEDVKINRNFCLVLGNESRGVTPEIQKISDKFLKIPLSGNMESLNVAVAAGILFYSLNKQSSKAATP